jgi:CelD/BcsL family acetyltransferase involved in cellulose biosynthesis
MFMQADQVLDRPPLARRDSVAPMQRAETAATRLSGPLKQLFVSHDIFELEVEWRRFEQTADCTVFQSFDWLATWQKHVGACTGTTPAIVVGRDAANEILFILPLATRRAGLLTHLTFLGRDLCDYNAPLLAPGAAAALGPEFARIWNDIRATLQADPRHRHDVIRLDKMPEMVGSQRNPLMQLAVTLHPSGAYLTALGREWEAFYTEKRSSSTRRRDRTKRKKLAESGEISLVTPEHPHEVAETLSVLVDQKQRAFARMGVANMFDRKGYRGFFLELTTGASARKIAHVSRLQVGDVYAATNLGLMFRGGYYHVLASYDEGPLSRFGPGAAHLHDLMRYALEHGCTFFDFTIGDEPYKRDWCDTELKLYDCVEAATWRGWISATAASSGQRLKRMIKQSTWLWPAAMRFRETVAAVKARLRPGAQPPSDRP